MASTPRRAWGQTHRLGVIVLPCSERRDVKRVTGLPLIRIELVAEQDALGSCIDRRDRRRQLARQLPFLSLRTGCALWTCHALGALYSLRTLWTLRTLRTLGALNTLRSLRACRACLALRSRGACWALWTLSTRGASRTRGAGRPGGTLGACRTGGTLRSLQRELGPL